MQFSSTVDGDFITLLNIFAAWVQVWIFIVILVFNYYVLLGKKGQSVE
jgi:hypothetical protein